MGDTTRRECSALWGLGEQRDLEQELADDTLDLIDPRLSDKIFTAFYRACDEAEFEIARALLDVLKFMSLRSPQVGLEASDQFLVDGLLAAHERLQRFQREALGHL